VSPKRTSKEPPRFKQVPDAARKLLLGQLKGFAGQPLQVEFRGRYGYISHAGSPLCRLGYRGALDDWDFAIYRYTRDRYDADVFGMPDHDSTQECLSVALRAYDLI
jgi:hypothetical protein